ncbi:MAG: hypothetical protein E6I96_07160 [Chloroflexi bacterium]|nr:MAG: hypothetical protein E6I96_07160 [Chloroflexota bacterium]
MAVIPAGRILVAVSGGPDSTALLLALHEAGRDIVAAHFDHALREGSDAVAGEVANLCEGTHSSSAHASSPAPRSSPSRAAPTPWLKASSCSCCAGAASPASEACPPNADATCVLS